MRYVMAFAAAASNSLADGVTRASVSEECRDAALAFMTGVAVGWTKLDLGRWLTGPYARATRHSAHGERTAVSAAGAIDPSAVEDVLMGTRARLLAALEKAALSSGALGFAEEAIERAFVRRAFDEDGFEAWVPVDGARMRLRDRVSSLFVADYLNDPMSYRALYVCHRCENVVFDERAPRLGMCSAHGRVSGTILRGDLGFEHRASEYDAPVAAGNES